jgi:ABC-type transporter Mla maintaining outer membrane lipid asymmetry ATPase subunit MlaF
MHGLSGVNQVGRGPCEALLARGRASSGLDPISASDFDALISTLQQTLGLMVFMVTHDLDSQLVEGAQMRIAKANHRARP